MRKIVLAIVFLSAMLLRADYLMWGVELPKFASTDGNAYYAVLAAVRNADGEELCCVMKNPVKLDSNGAVLCQRTYLKEAMYAFNAGNDPASPADDRWGYNGNTDWSGFTFQVWILDSNNNRVFSTGNYATGRREWQTLLNGGNAGKRVRYLERWVVKPAPDPGLLFSVG